MTPRKPYRTVVKAGTRDLRWQIETPRFGEIRAQLASAGEPIGRVQVELSRGEARWDFRLAIVDGRLTMRHTIAGSYEMRIKSIRHEDVVVPVQVLAGKTTHLGTLTFERLDEVQGQVLDSRGQPLAGVWIGLDPWLPKLWHRHDTDEGTLGTLVLAKSDENGQFRVPSRARMEVFGYKPGYAPTSWRAPERDKASPKDGPASETHPKLVLHRAGEVRIQVPPLTKGQRAYWRYLLVRCDGPPVKSKHRRPRGRPLEPGEALRLIGLEPGLYRLQVANFEKVQDWRRKSVAGESYYEEIRIDESTRRTVRVR